MKPDARARYDGPPRDERLVATAAGAVPGPNARRAACRLPKPDQNVFTNGAGLAQW